MEALAQNHETAHLYGRIAELETALCEARQDLCLTRAWIRLACQGHGASSSRPAGESGMALPRPVASVAAQPSFT